MVDAMATYDLSQHSVDPINVYPLSEYPNPTGTYEFDFATLGSNQTSLINNLRIGDLVYVSSPGKIKKLEKQTANAVAKSSILGPVNWIKDDDGNSYVERDFTSDGGEIGVIHTRGIELFSSKLFIHDQNGTDPDVRVPFNFTVHAATGAVLEGLVKKVNLDPETVIFA